MSISYIALDPGCDERHPRLEKGAACDKPQDPINQEDAPRMQYDGESSPKWNPAWG